MRLKSPCYVELNSLEDFGRFVCALERIPLPAFSLYLKADHIFAVQADIINGRPVIYFVKNILTRQGQYLGYRITGGTEEVTIVDSIANPTFVYSPIINIDKFPSTMLRNARVGRKSGYIAISLRDISSLAKIAAYKTIYDEPPLPLFLFSKKSHFNKDRSCHTSEERFVIGAAINLAEADTISYFYYVVINEDPKYPFVRFSSQRPDKPSFSNRIDEHGYVYLKLIRLATTHPLVGTYD